MSTSDRLLSVLTLFTIERPHLSVEEAAAELKLAVSTTYRYFRSLTAAGLLASFANGRYVLGPTIIRYDRQLRLADPLISAAAPLMRELAPLLPPHCLLLLCRLYGDQVMCVHQEYAQMPNFAVSYERGRPMPLYRGAASKVVLAHLPPRFLRRFQVRYAEELAARGLGRDWPQLRLRLRELRATGVHVTQSELDEGMMGIAAPLFEPAGNVIGSLSIVLRAAEAHAALIEDAAGRMRASAAQVGERLAALATHAQA